MRGFSTKVALALVGAILPLLGLEMAARIVKGKPITYFVNFIEARQTLLKSVYPAQHDSDLGWIPRTGAYGTHNYWGKSITILDHGVRYNGRLPTSEQGTIILAVGDSFTFGDQVSDHETWPAQLEKLSGNRVVNGGVFAYGLDQTVLRAEQLVDVFTPSVLIIGLIPDDINRVELSTRSGASKPFFRVVESELFLGNIPVPVPDSESTGPGLFRDLFGYSFLMDGLMRKLGYEAFWYAGGWENRRVHTDGARVSCFLMDRVSELGRRGDLELILLVQYLESEVWVDQRSEVKNVLECAAQNGIGIVDMHTQLRKMAESNPTKLASLYYYQSHMTPQGNALVARIMFDYLY